MKRRYKRKKKLFRDVALRRIRSLFEQAANAPEHADRYVEIARKIGMKYRVRIPPKLQKQFCKHCYVHLVPGRNCRVRINDGKMVYHCDHCRKYMRFPLK